jgi:anti-anti-sigma factor
MTVVLGPCSQEFCIVYVDGALLMPVSHDLRRNVRRLLRRGKRLIVIDLSRVSRIDAAGVGELVRAHNMMLAVNGSLRVVNAVRRVRDIVSRVGLLELLSADADLQAA